MERRVTAEFHVRHYYLVPVYYRPTCFWCCRCQLHCVSKKFPPFNCL